MTPVVTLPTHRAPVHINPMQWHQAVGIARQSCARVFRDGGAARDALTAFGIVCSDDGSGTDWRRAVDLIAEHLCATPMRKAA